MVVKPIKFEKLPRYKPDYEHVRCKCGGIIGAHDGVNVTCIMCNKAFNLYELNYDILLANHKTGWFFPVKYKEISELNKARREELGTKG